MTTISILLGRDGTGLNEADFSEWVSYADAALGKSLADEIGAGLELDIESRGERDQIQTDHVSGSDPEMVETVRGALREAWDAFCSEAY